MRYKWHVTPIIAHNNFLLVLAYIYVLPDSRFLYVKKIPNISLDQWINLDIKIILVGDERQPIKLIWGLYTNSTSSSVYLKEVKRDNNKIM